jgi:hypothetical protein
MLHFARQLYLSPNIRHPEILKWRLRHNAGNLGVYVIVPGDNKKESIPGANQLEILHCANLHQGYYKAMDLTIVGLAEGYWQAIELVAKITGECVDKTGGTDLKAYLFPECQSGQHGGDRP